MQKIHHIGPETLTFSDIKTVIEEKMPLALSDLARQKIKDCRAYLETKIAETDTFYYGINTGFGSLCNIKISDDDIAELQENLVLSHSCGTGDEVPAEVVRLILFLKIKNLSYGYSGVRLTVAEKLTDLYNADILPVIYQQGSLGASGDLAPLAHMSLTLLGRGKVRVNGQLQTSAEALQTAGIEPIKLAAKEGLALLNGTQFSTAYALHNLLRSEKLLKIANLCAAMSIDAFDCRLSPFNHQLHDIRPHAGQVKTAAFLWEILQESEIAQREKNNVQDPYAFRCVPQVHGATADTVAYAKSVVTTEINAVTDNPNIFPATDDILSGGNFHAQPIALILDFTAIALAEIGSISERRTFQLISGQRGLPPFLTPHPGLHSGLMIAQYTAAGIVSQNKQFCTPASVDSIVSSNGQEDHVSMAANAATKLQKVVDNVERVLAIELLTAAQALDFRKPLRSAPTLENLKEKYRAVVPFLEKDRLLSDDIHRTVEFIRDLRF